MENTSRLGTIKIKYFVNPTEDGSNWMTDGLGWLWLLMLSVYIFAGIKEPLAFVLPLLLALFVLGALLFWVALAWFSGLARMVFEALQRLWFFD